MFGNFFGSRRGGGNEGANSGSTGEFDSKELQDAINEINEAQGSDTESNATKNGWEELAAMDYYERLAQAAADAKPGAWMNDEEKAELRREQEEEQRKQTYSENLAQMAEEAKPGAWMSDEEREGLRQGQEVEMQGLAEEQTATEEQPQQDYYQRLAQMAEEAKPGLWMSDEEREELRQEQKEEQRKQVYSENLAQVAAEAKPGAWMSDEEKAEQEAAKEAPKGKKGIFGWMNKMKQSVQELWRSLTAKEGEAEMESVSVPVPEMYNTENLVQDFFERNFQGMDEKAKALRMDIAEKATLSRIAGERAAAKQRADLEGRALTAEFEQSLENEAAFDTRHILESYYLNGGRLGNDINGEELSEEEQIAWKLASEPHKHGQLNLTHLFNEYPRREAETPDDYEARLKGYAKQDLQREAQLKADTLVKWENETPEEFEARWKKAVEMRKEEGETPEEFEARWQREVGMREEDEEAERQSEAEWQRENVWTAEMREVVGYQEEIERRLAKGVAYPKNRAILEELLKRLDDRLDELVAAERAKEAKREEDAKQKKDMEPQAA